MMNMNWTEKLYSKACNAAIGMILVIYNECNTLWNASIWFYIQQCKVRELQRNSTIIVSLPNVGRNGETDFSSRVRSKCLEFLRDIQEDNNVDIHGVEDDHAEKWK